MTHSSTSITFDTVGGTQSAAVYLPTAHPAPVVLIAPALGIRAAYYEGLCRALAAAGCVACAVDSPGHGTSPARPSRVVDWGYAELCEHFASALRVLRDARPGAPAILVGHSIGGQAALMLSGKYPDLVDHVVLVASGSPFWSSWEGTERFKILASISLCGLIARVLGYFPGDRVGFGGEEARRLIVEWASVARTGSYNVEGFAGDVLLSRPGPDVLAIVLRGDAWAPRAAMMHALEKLRTRKVTVVEWLDAPHAGNHNRWPSAPAFVVSQILNLLKSPS